MSGIDMPIEHLERVEIDAWADLYEAAGTLEDNPCGITVHREDPYIATAVAGFDVLALNRVIGWGEAPQRSVFNLRKIINVYRQVGVQRIFLQLHPSLIDADAGAALRETGFVPYNNWIKLYRKAEPLTGIKSDFKVVKIGPEQAGEFGRIVTECFEWDRRLIPWISSVVGRDNWHLYLALDGDRPVATGGFYLSGEYAWVDMAATLPEARGRGAQAILMQRRIEDMIKLGCQHLVVETAEDRPEHSAPSYRNMIRFGFEVAYVRPNYLFQF